MDQIIVYKPNDRQKIGFFRMWRQTIRNIVQYRDLIYQLFLRDFFGVYKKSIIGIGWLFFSPLLGIISWVLMNTTGILKPGDVGVPYPAYVLLSTSIWGLFLGLYAAAADSLLSGNTIILQVSYPHEILLVSQVARYLAGFLISFILNIIMLILFGIFPHWSIIFFPILAIPLFFLGTAIGLLVSVLSIVTTEIRKIMDLGLGLLLFITPVIYSSKISNPILQIVVQWNPLTYLVGFPRDLILYGKIFTPERYIGAVVFALCAFLLSWHLFFISEQRVIEKMF